MTHLGIWKSVFRRNFGSYFSGPLGWLFICVFVSLSVLAAFWPHDFFNNNLANLDSLNRLFPMVMLVFVPAITMGLWADERRQGTDELLLTLPATDFQIVLGKYAAALGIYTAALVFSGICTYSVLKSLGNPDFGLFCVTYLGYWCIGWAMLAIGMVASFITSSLPVAYILGALFNAPLVFAANADVVLGVGKFFGKEVNFAELVERWSFSEQFRDFARGVFSLSSVVWFALIVVVMFYMCMVLLGRRRWQYGLGGYLLFHYTVRVLSMVAILVSVNLVFADHDVRFDGSAEKLSSLSPATIRLLDEIRSGSNVSTAVTSADVAGTASDAAQTVDTAMRSVQIEAFISPEVPKSFVEARLNLVTMLREIAARSGGKVRVRIYDTKPFSEEAERAEKAYGIYPQMVGVQERGRFDQEEIFMGVVFRCGMEKVTLPFIARGIPAEYELVRSLMTVTSQKRKVLGVLETDAGLFQTVDPTRGTLTGDAAIITELKKSYDVRKIDPNSPITEPMDALLAVQPSTLSPEAWVNFMDYVKTGNSVIIFEDPFPIFAPSIPGTSVTKNAPTNPMFGMMMPPQPLPKANDRELWDLLGVNFARDRVVFQNYNPEVRYRQFPKEFVWIDTTLRYEKRSVLNPNDVAVSGLQKVLFPHPGYVTPLAKSGLTFTPLVRTGVETGFVPYDELLKTNEFGEKRIQPNPRRTLTNESYVLAAKIEGTVTLPAPPKPAPSVADPSVANAGVMPQDAAKSADAANQPANTTPVTTEAAPSVETTTELPTEVAGEPGPQGTQGVTGTAVTPSATGTAAATEVAVDGTVEAKINVLLVADLDCTTNQFFMIREQGLNEEYGIQFDFDNVTMTLNLIDRAIGEERFCEIRSRRRAHRTLSKIDALTKDAENAATKEIESLREEFNKTSASIQAEANKKLNELQTKLEKQYEKNGQISDAQMLAVIQELAKIKERQVRQNEQKIQELTREMEDNIKEIDTKLVRQEQKIQNRYKLWSILLPPIPPLLISLIVLGVRHAREKEGASRKRVRHAV